jgi:hypothetical protein
MKKTPVPDDVRRFILTSIPTVPYLEALLLLRSRPNDAWDAPLLARRLYVTETQALGLLQSLAEAGVAAAAGDGRYAYAPQAGELAQVIDALALTYSVNLLDVTELIHSRVDKRALQFADAFRWTRKEN